MASMIVFAFNELRVSRHKLRDLTLAPGMRLSTRDYFIPPSFVCTIQAKLSSADLGTNITPLDESSAILHATREYHAYPGAQYALPTDDVERQRLLLQHNLLKRIFENKVLLAPVTFTQGDRVLDIGTGPGLWALDMEQAVGPAVHICGVDIESRLFPASPPKNMAFQVESVLSLPSDWTDTFTLVHQRLLMVALQIPEWPQALGEIYRVLRPGGWVQLGEWIPWIEGGNPDKPCTEKIVSLTRCLTKSRNLYVDCALHMPAMLEQAGFVDVKAEGRMLRMGKWGGEDGIATAINHAAIFRGMKTPLLQAGGYGKVAKESEYDALMEGMEKEWDEIPGTQIEPSAATSEQRSNFTRGAGNRLIGSAGHWPVAADIAEQHSTQVVLFRRLSVVLTTFMAQTSPALSPDNTAISDSILVALQRAQANGSS
ncbi:S-adenosyl-L-methionine-dependent methyltransferase [Mycena galopus ATCC 62051]|nr:S-adenosyl-L-methionine-dependent methyltransferase [Mycena galopus ATCC 62051]